MVPVMEQLEKKYAGKLIVEFHNVKQDPTYARKYGIRLIPTQIFLDARGDEVYRHEGYFPLDEIEIILAQMGVTVDG
jgi:thioredoxin 1